MLVRTLLVVAAVLAVGPAARAQDPAPPPFATSLTAAIGAYETARLGPAARKVDATMRGLRRRTMRRCGRSFESDRVRFDEGAHEIVFMTIIVAGRDREDELLTAASAKLARDLAAIDHPLVRRYETLLAKVREFEFPPFDHCSFVRHLRAAGSRTSRTPEARALRKLARSAAPLDDEETKLSKDLARAAPGANIPLPGGFLDIIDKRVLPEDDRLTRALEND